MQKTDKFSHYQFIGENANKTWAELSSQISGYLTVFGLSHMNYVEYLFNWTTQLDNTSLAQPVTKQCFMLFSVCVCVCVKRAAIKTQRWGIIIVLSVY